ncbi:hypothetical protein CMO91_04415 [Candidatus Woesearchaeota archaeon]|nr:hypothetical protein [Candidatus Woesearchaeota archaeon]
MSLLQIALLLTSCVALGQPVGECAIPTTPVSGNVAGSQSAAPTFTGQALDVVLSAESVVVWDLASGSILYEKAADEQRPIASVSKLLTALVVREHVPLSTEVEVPAAVRVAQRQGVDVSLPIGAHVTASDLLLAGLVASANDAMVTLAYAVAEDEDAFVTQANTFAAARGMTNTRIANATGLSGGSQHSTAHDVRTMLELAYRDPVLRDYLSRPGGTLVTQEGSIRRYTTTNRLLKTYVPVIAAKTGYTREAKENLALLTEGSNGQRVGAVVLGSNARFQDSKVLVEWIWRNYSWPS